MCSPYFHLFIHWCKKWCFIFPVSCEDRCRRTFVGLDKNVRVASAIGGVTGCRLHLGSGCSFGFPPCLTKRSLAPVSANWYQACLVRIKHRLAHRLALQAFYRSNTHPNSARDSLEVECVAHLMRVSLTLSPILYAFVLCLAVRDCSIASRGKNFITSCWLTTT